MADFFATFHVEGGLLLAQFANFAVVFVLVYFLILKPLQKVMRERTGKIEQGLENAQKAETALMMAGHEKERIINEGHQEAKTIVLGAESRGEAIVEDSKVEAEKAAHTLKEHAIKEIETLREHQNQEVRKQSINLVISGVEAILREKIDAKKAEDIITSALKK
jgi:F-type H+-transporting ATPase subunit b